MITNYIRIALRHFKRHKFFSFLNIIGLAIGIAASMLSFLFVINELSYDRFHEKSDRIYRIVVHGIVGNTIINQTFTPAPMPTALYMEFPEIESICRITDAGSSSQFRYKDIVHKESDFLIADTTFFNIFSTEFTYGTPDPSLLLPNHAVITDDMARKYFGNRNPVGEIMTIDDEINITISAVVKDFPENSHFHFDMLISLLTFDGFYNSTNWWNNNFRTYILFKKNTDPDALEKKFPDFVDKYLFDGKYKQSAEKGNKWELSLQALTNIHLHSHLAGEFEGNGNSAYVLIFAVIAILILLIACINYINLATAKSATRAREIGIRKVVGSGRRELIRQFLSESIVISFISTIIALLITEVVLEYLPDFLGSSINIPYLSNVLIIPILIGMTLIIGVISGLYPAMILSLFKPVDILRNRLVGVKRGNWARNTLVVFQFTISIILIIGTMVISRQLKFIQNEQLGFNKEQVLVINNANMVAESLKPFKNELLQIPGIQNASIAFKLPGKRFHNIGFGAEGIDDGFTLNINTCDPDYLNVLQMEMKQGRFLSNEFGSDSSAVILNEAAVKLLGWDDPIGKQINNWARERQYFNVIGVVKDLHYESMHTEIRPMAFFHIDSPWGWTPRYIAVKVSTDNINKTIKSIEHAWNKLDSGMPLEYSFFDELYNNLYQNEIQTQRLFITFSSLTIFIACLGLFGLAAFMIQRRTHEIGIRKVLGASVVELVILLSREFTKWIIVANVIAWPLAWMYMRNWLNNFAYKINIPFWYFPFAGIMALAIALITVSYQSIRSALKNPIDSIRYE